MGKYIKRIIVTMLISSIVVFVVQSATASENLKDQYMVDDSTLDSIRLTLGIITQEKEQYGLSEVDFSSLSVGAPILAYEYVNDSLEPLGFFYYPLIYDGNLVALAIKRDDVDFTSIVTALVDGINKNVTIDEDFALVYDSDACYLYSTSGLAMLNKINRAVKTRSLITDEKAVELQNSEFARSPTTTSVEPVSYMPSRSSVYLSVPYISQFPPTPVSNICWAATAVSIGKYLRPSTSFTADGVAQAYHRSGTLSVYNVYTPSVAIAYILNNYYALSSFGFSAYTSYSTTPTLATITGSLNAGRPVAARWQWSGGYHSSVVCGTYIFPPTVTMSVMDPEFGFITASMGTSNFTYTNPNNGTSLTLTSHYVM